MPMKPSDAILKAQKLRIHLIAGPCHMSPFRCVVNIVPKGKPRGNIKLQVDVGLNDRHHGLCMYSGVLRSTYVKASAC